MPIVKGSEINDSPFQPISKYARDLIAELGDETRFHGFTVQTVF
jgi:magnesium chelatase subunit I